MYMLFREIFDSDVYNNDRPMNERERIDDKSFDSAIKSIVVRDFFPDLRSNQNVDETITNFRLKSFTDTYIAKDEAKFIDRMEMDSKILKSAAPKSQIDPKIVESQFKGFPIDKPNILFNNPEPLPIKSVPALLYNEKKRPRIDYSQTRFTNEEPGSNLFDYQIYHPFTTESSASESESEFEGRTSYLNSIINMKPTEIRREKLERYKQKKELTAKGRELFNSLMSRPL